MANHKWSWHYRITIGHLNEDRMYKLKNFCCEKFSNDVSRWDLSFIRRRLNPSSWFPRYYYTRVKVHFKHEEDLVLFKLTYSPPSS